MIQLFTNTEQTENGFNLYHKYFVNAKRAEHIDAEYQTTDKDKNLADILALSYALKDITETDKLLGGGVIRERKVKQGWDWKAQERYNIYYYTGKAIYKDTELPAVRVVYINNAELWRGLQIGFIVGYQKYIERILYLIRMSCITINFGEIKQMDNNAISYIQKVYQL